MCSRHFDRTIALEMRGIQIDKSPAVLALANGIARSVQQLERIFI